MSDSKKKLQEKLDEVPEEKQKPKSKKDKLREAVELIKAEYGAEFEPVKNIKFKIEKVINYINAKYDFRYNVINTDTEYKLKDSKKWLYFDDRDYRDVKIDIKMNNISVSDEDFKTIIFSRSVSDEFNPFMDYFNRAGKCESEFEYEGKGKEKIFKSVKSGKDYIREFCSQIRLSGERKIKNNIDDKSVEIKLDSIDGLPFSGELYVENEMISYHISNEKEFVITADARGINDTKAVSHFANTDIYTNSEKENREYFVEGFRKWFTAMVIGLVKDEPSMYNINQTCLVLVGSQGKYKTTWLKNIVPAELQLKYFYGSNFQVHNKDHEKFLAYTMLINFDEMAAYNKTDVESIKSMISRDQIVLRLPYAKADVHLKRRASFAATQNNVEFLKDETGSRRWFVIEVENISFTEDFDIAKMYAQGLQHMKDGLKYWFDNEDIKKIEGKNDQFQLKTFEYQLVEKHYEVPTEEDKATSELVRYMSSTDIAIKLSKDNNVNVNNTVVTNIGKALASQGFKKICRLGNVGPDGKRKRTPLWCVKEALSSDTKPLNFEEKGYSEDVI